MTYEQLKLKVKKLTFYLEFVLAIFIVFSVVIGMVDLLRYLKLIFLTDPIDTYELLQKFLGHVLLLVVGVELVVMLVFHSPASVMEVLLYAVARKVLIGNEGMGDFMLGIVAIAAIFAIRKYLFVEVEMGDARMSNTFPAIASLKYINGFMDISIPEEMGDTIGEAVSSIAKSSGQTVKTGAEFYMPEVRIKVLKMKDGIIQKVAIIKNEG